MSLFSTLGKMLNSVINGPLRPGCLLQNDSNRDYGIYFSRERVVCVQEGRVVVAKFEDFCAPRINKCKYLGNSDGALVLPREVLQNISRYVSRYVESEYSHSMESFLMELFMNTSFVDRGGFLGYLREMEQKFNAHFLWVDF